MKLMLTAAAGVLAALAGSLPNRAPVPNDATPSPIIELRQYTLRAHQRDVLMDMFDAHFVEPQEAAGITVIGQFRNLDDPNKFVWLRGYPSMEVRGRALAEFYGGPVWKQFRTAANETIIDNDNVLLLRPVHPGGGFAVDPSTRRPVDARGNGAGLVVATVYHLDPTPEKQRDFVDFFEHSATPLLARAGGAVVASYVPEESANNFPRLPVRDGEHVFVWFARFADERAYGRFTAALAAMPVWRDSVGVELSSKVREPVVMRLRPSARSLVQGSGMREAGSER